MMPTKGTLSRSPSLRRCARLVLTVCAAYVSICVVNGHESPTDVVSHEKKHRSLRRGRFQNQQPAAADIDTTEKPGRNVIIKYKTEEGRYEAEGRAAKHKGKDGREGGRPHRLKKIKALAGYYTEDDIAELSSRPDIEYVEDDAPVKRFCSATSSVSGRGIGSTSRAFGTYGIEMTQADQVKAKTINGEPIMTVCIIDSGLDTSHEDIQQNNVMGASFGKKVGEWNNSNDPHGTHVTGTLAALGQNMCGVVGVESHGNLRLLIARVFDDDGSDAKTSEIVEAAEWCADQGADVINMSLGNVDKVKAEEQAMAELWGEGRIIVAAAGNFGDQDNKKNYPASFDEVISVGMVGEDEVIAPASQKNNQVELAGPGIFVLSTTKSGTGRLASYVVDGLEYESIPMENSMPTNTADGLSGVLVDCGYGNEVCPFSYKGPNMPHTCLIERGFSHPDVTITFQEKALSCEESGGIGVIVYNNKGDEGPIRGIVSDEDPPLIPVVGISQDEGNELKKYLHQKVTIISRDDANYEYMTGTSMATPFVAGIAAIIWSHHPECKNWQIRRVLQITAQDRGEEGRDSSYGFGIIRAKDALDYLDQYGCPDA